MKQASVNATLSIGMPPLDRQRTDGRKSICVPLPEKYISPCYDIDLCLLTLKTFSVIPAHMMNICSTFH